MNESTLIALISATPVAIPPAVSALADELPSARVLNLLDDRLLADADAAGGLTPALSSRMQTLIEYAVGAGADAVLLTCSLYGQVTQQVSVPVPVLAPDEAVFTEAASGAYGTVLVVASFDAAKEDSVQRLTEIINASGRTIEVHGVTAEAARAAAGAEDPEQLAAVLADAIGPHLDGIDVVLLGQYSLAPGRARLQELLGTPVISGPGSAAIALRDRLGHPVERGPIGAIADDYTGATDVALAFRHAGLRTLLYFGVPTAHDAVPPHDAVVVGLKSRTIPPADAVAEALAAHAWLADAGVATTYFKYCSTFDSTSEGNIGPVTDALADASGSAVVVTTPASPAHERTVYNGQLFVAGVPLAQTHMAHHPLTPMTDSSLPRVLSAQTAHRVESLTRAQLQGGVVAVRRVLDAAHERGVRHIVADAIDEADLRTVAQAVADHPVVAGAVGLAAALAELRAAGYTHETAAEDPVGEVPTAILAGSCSARTLDQIAHFSAEGNPSYRIDPFRSWDPGTLARGALEWVDQLPAGATPLLFTSLPPAELRGVQEALGTEASAALLESALAQVAIGLRARGVRRLISAGGETSGSIVHALRVQGAIVGGEVAPGVPWIYAFGTEPLALLLKSGNFGDVAMFSRASSAEHGWGVTA
jgi:uncharacterized protein YgbK (DUF1537 family)